MKTLIMLFITLLINIQGVDGMARVDIVSYGSNASPGTAYLTFHITDLQNPEHLYDDFAYSIGGGFHSCSAMHTVTGLNCGQTYTVDARAKWAGVWYPVGTASQFIPCPAPPPDPPSAPTGLVISNITQTSATASWNAASGATSYQGHWQFGSAPFGDFSGNTSRSITTNSLSAGGNFTFSVRSVNSDGVSSYTSASFSTPSDPGPSRPANWLWNATEVDAFINNKGTTNLTAARWNAFVDRVNQFRTYKGRASISAYAPADKQITAAIMRTVANGINDMYALTDQRPRTVQTGDTIFGSYFLMLADMLAFIT